MDQPPQANRRKYPRVRAEVLVLLRRAEGEMQLGQVVDLGIGGIRFRCFGQDHELDEVIEVRLFLYDDIVTMVGKTVRVTDMVDQTQEVALAFERVSDPETLKRFCGVGQADES